VRNTKWISKLITYGLILACIAVFSFKYIGGSLNGIEDDTTPATELKAAFPDKQAVQNLSSLYRSIAENDRLILKLKEDTLGIQIVEKQSGYMWSSDIIKPDVDNNETWLNFMKSGLSIEYFDKDKSNSIRTELTSEVNKSIQVKQIDHGFQATIRFNDLQIGMDMIVKLEDGQLVVDIPQKSILEGDQFKLASIFVYPFLGATKGGEIGGYMFIPDGSGALIKLADNQGKFKTAYEAKIYGVNNGIDVVLQSENLMDGSKPAYSAQFPVFGMVHEEKKHALFGVVENGQYNAKILSYPNGVNTPYNWTSVQFLIRESYLQPTSRSMGGVVVFEKTRNHEDMQIRYSFLEGADASYIGMAKTYRSYLIGKGELQEAPKAEGNFDIPIHLDILGAETEGGLFANRIIPMTTVDQLASMLNQLHAAGVSRTSVVYKGWSKGGLSGVNPAPISFEPTLGTTSDFAKLNEQLNSQGGKLYYYSDFTTAYEHSKRFSVRSDAARKIDKSVLTLPTYHEVYDSMYYMSSKYMEQIVQANISAYKNKGIGSLAVDVTPYEVFSERLDGKSSSRSETAEVYGKMMGSLKTQVSSMVMYQPNDYMLRYADQLMDIPMDSSQYIYTSETVPFEQIVLKGYKDYFAKPINFFANPQKNLLKMIETGSFPSYYLTKEPSYRLKHTNSNDVYASAFADWKEDIVKTYKLLNEALKPVQNATIEERTMLADGVIQVTYSNGKAIVVNYNNQSYDGIEGSVPPLGYRVIEVKR
jgi:hypothetical protein